MLSRWVSIAGIGSLAVTSALVMAVAAAPAAEAGTVTRAFTQPGGPYLYVVPAGVTLIHVDAVGGSGGSQFGNLGGAAARVQADLPVVPGARLYVHVAGNGTGTVGGVNGGGAGNVHGGSGGGGASDIRAGADVLGSRILVAAGGGGSSFFGTAGAAEQAATNGGGCFDPPAQPGTATAGGAGGGGCDGTAGTDGTAGAGGDGGIRPSGNNGGGGGGAGLYGGGGGGPYSGGAGGSNHVLPAASNSSTSLAVLGAAPRVTISYTRVAASMTVTAAPATLPADGSSTTTVTATVRDAGGNPVSGDTVAFTSSDSGQRISAVTDNQDGTYTAVVTASTTVHTVVVTATDSTGSSPVTGSTSIVQTGPSPSPTATPSSGSVPVNGAVQPALAATGTNAGALAGVAAILIILGAALVQLGRPRRYPSGALGRTL